MQLIIRLQPRQPWSDSAAMTHGIQGLVATSMYASTRDWLPRERVAALCSLSESDSSRKTNGRQDGVRTKSCQGSTTTNSKKQVQNCNPNRTSISQTMDIQTIHTGTLARI